MELRFHKCPTCPYRSKQQFSIIRHFGLHRLSAPFACDSSTPQPHDCEYCDFESALKAAVMNHVTAVHQNQEISYEYEQYERSVFRKYNCNSCGFQTYSLLVLTNHYNSCTSGVRTYRIDKWFQCEQCAVTGKRFWNLKLHIISKHLNDSTVRHRRLLSHSKQIFDLQAKALRKLKKSDEWLKCEQCSHETKSKRDLKCHSLIEHPSRDSSRWFKCDQCLYRTRQRYSLKYHILRRHTPVEEIHWVKCQSCSYQTKSKSELTKHVKTIHGDPATIKWFQCEQCSYRTKWQSALKNHTKVKHVEDEDVEWFRCGQCEHKTKRKSLLGRHILDKHADGEDIKWFECERCQLKFKRIDQLKSHFSTKKHLACDEIRWFKCEMCPGRYRWKRCLKKHVLEKHKPL